LGFVACQPFASDFLTTILGLEFAPVREKRVTSDEGGFPICYVSKEDPIVTKKVLGEDRDLNDIEEIRRADWRNE